MSGIKQPVTQVRLTNVCLVRLRAAGLRFEVACYPNKVANWREGIEKDLDEVLQSRHIFTNVSKGVFASHSDLEHAFGDAVDKERIIKEILTKGDIQVSEKERALESARLVRDIAAIVCEKTLNLDTRLPFSQAMVEAAIKEIHYSVALNKSAKSQALKVARLLKQVINIERVHMRIEYSLPLAIADSVKKALETDMAGQSVESVRQITRGDKQLVCVVAIVEPGRFRVLEDRIRQLTRGEGAVEVLDYKVAKLTDSEEKELKELEEQTNNSAPAIAAGKAQADDAKADKPKAKEKEKDRVKGASRRKKRSGSSDDEELAIEIGAMKLMNRVRGEVSEEEEDEQEKRKKLQQEQRRKKKERKKKNQTKNSKQSESESEENENE